MSEAKTGTLALGMCPRCTKVQLPQGMKLCIDCQHDEIETEAAAKAVQEEKSAEAAKPLNKPVLAPVPPARKEVGKRMGLANIRTGYEELPYKLIVYGVPGVGKTLFAADAPDPIFIPVETSANLMADRFQQPETWSDIINAIEELEKGTHKYKTVVIDTVDKAEPMVWRQCVEEDRESVSEGKRKYIRTIEDVGGGFQKGYTAAAGKWRFLLSKFERLISIRGMNIVLIAHACVKTFNDPIAGSYERWEMKLSTNKQGNIVATLAEWCDAVLFANFHTAILKDKKGKELKRAESNGSRALYTRRTAAFDAKNRYDLPPLIDFQWADFDRRVRENRRPDALIQFIQEKCMRLSDPKIAEWVTGALEKKPGVQQLSAINMRLNERIEAMEMKEEESSANEEQSSA